MLTRNHTDWSLLAKYLAGETSEKENVVVRRWLELRPQNRALMNELLSEWKGMENMSKQFNVDNAWGKLNSRIVAEKPAPVFKTPQTVLHSDMIWFTPFRIAASLIFIALLGAALFVISGRFVQNKVYTAVDENLKSVVLPDGSTVTLNSETTLTYPKSFSGKNRIVSLNGEAFFEVTPDKSKPFIIRAGNASIRVVGTSFNVDTKNGTLGAEVFVSTGIVELFETANRQNSVLLEPGFIGSLAAGKNAIARKSEDENKIGWKTGKLNFYDTKFSEAAEILKHVYHVEIELRDKSLDTILINGHYQNDHLDTILEVVCKTNSLKVEKSNNKIYLSK